MATLKKSNSDRMLLGVCGGIAEYFGWESTIVRIVFVLAALLGVGASILIYIVMAIVMPRY